MAIVKRSSIPDDSISEANRGARAKASVGDVAGSGSGAGGSGGPEDYDSDPQGGGGKFPAASPHPEGKAADASKHGSR